MVAKHCFSFFEKGFVGIVITFLFSVIVFISLWTLDNRAYGNGRKEAQMEVCQRTCRIENSSCNITKNNPNSNLICECQNGSTYQIGPQKIQ